MPSSVLIQCKFYHYVSVDASFYYINCKNISHNTYLDEYHNHDHEFFYSDNKANYHVTCKLLSHSLIENLLNGIDPDINDVKMEYLSLNKKLNLENSLRIKLSSYIIERGYSDKNTGHYIAIKTTACTQDNVDNCLSRSDHVASDVGEYITYPQQQVDFNNINNISQQTYPVGIQAVSMIYDSQDSFNNQNGVEDFRQHQIHENDHYNVLNVAESSDHLQYHVSGRELDYDNNTNLLNRNIVDNVTQASTMIDNSNFLSCDDTQNLYGQQIEPVQFYPYQTNSDQNYNNDFNYQHIISA
ncbi:hypothetical protein RclHR1_09040005 [Rhizophagus clarus]|uniref:Uncharacterized protein n=1 Tax=Rhizophagus clarus TaxID=94130 RepID=A0A2Z6S360_9GLOM|nr:hypothetical protein RclHR1_09040005 [Rhizophagus clarus]GES73835.1 hypothetical protein GLOIN_2v1828111 [Rhizophagus clarus]